MSDATPSKRWFIRSRGQAGMIRINPDAQTSARHFREEAMWSLDQIESRSLRASEGLPAKLAKASPQVQRDRCLLDDLLMQAAAAKLRHWLGAVAGPAEPPPVSTAEDLIEWIALQHQALQVLPRAYHLYGALGRMRLDREGRPAFFMLPDPEILQFAKPVADDSADLEDSWLPWLEELRDDGPGLTPEQAEEATVQRARSVVGYVWRYLRQTAPGGPQEPAEIRSVEAARHALDVASAWAEEYRRSSNGQGKEASNLPEGVDPAWLTPVQRDILAFIHTERTPTVAEVATKIYGNEEEASVRALEGYITRIRVELITNESPIVLQRGGRYPGRLWLDNIQDK